MPKSLLQVAQVENHLSKLTKPGKSNTQSSCSGGKLGHWMLDRWSGESHCFEDSQAANCLRRSWECRAFHWVQTVTFTSSEPSTVPGSWCCQGVFGSLVKEGCDCRLPVVAECSLILARFCRPTLCFNSFILKLQSLVFH